MPRQKRSHLPLTQTRLKELLDYDPASGVFTHLKKKGGTAKAGTVAGATRKDGYIHIGVDGNNYLAHRLAWLYMTGNWPDPEVDHKDLNKWNNSWENLRESNRVLQAANVAILKNNKRGYKGVYWIQRMNKWYAKINVNKKSIYLGSFSAIEDAADAYRKAALKHFGEYARV